jgi:coenzyme F420-0:L-glutamate ligase/coenzyme F420-1:gamma-L-glutamate ligase
MTDPARPPTAVEERTAPTPDERAHVDDDRAAARLEVWGVVGLPEVQPGDDLPALLVAAAPELAQGDILVVTSKIVSKAEGRLLPSPTDQAGREQARHAAVRQEAVRVVAERGDTVIAQTRHGLVLAAAGVDASNADRDTLVLLPLDPDASAAAIRAAIHGRTGIDIAVVITDSAGRPWRDGLVDIAVGAAGIAPLRDRRGRVDRYGNRLEVSAAADVDAVAAVAELVKGKTAGVPAAVVRGLRFTDPGRGAGVLVRPAAEDMFSLGTAEAMRAAVTARRSVRAFSSTPVDGEALRRAVAAAATAPAPHHSEPWRFLHVRPSTRDRLLAAMRALWRNDLRHDGFSEDQIERRLRRGRLLYEAPELIVPCLVADAAHSYPDPRRASAEREMFVAAVGAGIENLLVTLAAEGLGACWVSSTMFCRPWVRDVLDLPPEWDPMGAIAIGHPAEPPPRRPPRDISALLIER